MLLYIIVQYIITRYSVVILLILIVVFLIRHIVYVLMFNYLFINIILLL